MLSHSGFGVLCLLAILPHISPKIPRGVTILGHPGIKITQEYSLSKQYGFGNELPSEEIGKKDTFIGISILSSKKQQITKQQIIIINNTE